MSAKTVDISSLLEVEPGYRQGRPCLRGTGITVHNVAATYLAGHTVEEMAASNPDLDPGLFHAAVAYYYANREQIDAEIEADLRQEEIEAERSPWKPGNF